MAAFPHRFDTDVLFNGPTARAYLSNQAGIAQWPQEIVNADLTLSAQDHRGKLLAIDTQARNITISLPLATDFDRWMVAIKNARGTNQVTIALSAGDTLNGVNAPLALNAGEWAILVGDGATTNWEALTYRSGDAADYSFDVITEPRAITSDDDAKLIIGDTSGGEITLSLPALAEAGPNYFVGFKNVQGGGTNNLIIQGNGGEQIDGAASFTLGEHNATVWIGSRDGRWAVIYDYNPVDQGTVFTDTVTIADAATPATVTHNLGARDVFVTFRGASTGDKVSLSVREQDENSIQVAGNVAGDYRVRVRA